MILRIVQESDDENIVMRLIGRIESEHLHDLEAQIANETRTIVLDLSEIKLVNQAAIRFLRLSEESARNRLHWDQKSDEYQAAHGDQLGRHQLAWGVWSISEDQLHVLGDVRAKDVLELGCGGAQWSIALEKRGARCVGLDNSARQLEHARRNADRAQTTAGRDNLLHRFRQLRMGRLVAGGANQAR